MTNLIDRVRQSLAGAALLALASLPLAAQAELQLLDRIAAVVNDSVIMESELDLRLQDIRRQLAADGRPQPPDEILRSQLMERLVMEKLQADLAQRAGIRVDDASLNQALAGIARQNGMELDQFTREVEADGIPWALFREQIRNEIAISQLHQRQVARRIRVTDREVERFLASESGRELFDMEFHLAHILISVDQDATPNQVDQARGQAQRIVDQARAGEDFGQLAVAASDSDTALKGGDLGWKPAVELPTLFADTAMTLREGEVSDPVRAGNGFHILKMLGRRGDAVQIVEQTQVRHILIRPDTLRTPAQARQLLEQLRERIQAGESFAELARQYSDDPGSAREGGDLGWVPPGQMVPEFEQTFRQTAVGELSPVFETEFGFHLLTVEGRRQEDMSDEYRLIRARQALQQRRYQEELEQWLAEMRSEAYVDIRL